MYNSNYNNDVVGRRGFLGRVACAWWLARHVPFLAPVGVARADGVDGASAKDAVARKPLYWSWWGWEPLAHYRRVGGIVGAVDTNAPGLEKWYDRLHSEELVATMADVGVNLACTHFFKGFGLVAERAEQQRTAALVRVAHGHGIKVLGYCQSRSLYHESFLAEEPHAEEWIQRDEQGKLRTWGRATYRWAPCILSREFRDYMKRAIRIGLEEVGLDGFHFDNDYCEPCYCKRCQEGFRAWLAKRHPAPQERFGRASFDDVRLPATVRSPAHIEDPIVQEWVRFRCESLAEYHAELCAHARSIRPGVILLGNPAYPRDGNSPYGRSVWPALLGRQLDLLFAENENFPGMEGGALVSQIRAFKQAAAVGYRVISTVWRRDKLTAAGLPESAGEVGLQVAEAAANGGVPGTNWALRPTNEGDRMRIDRPDLREALAISLRFARDTEKLLAGARPVRDVAVLRTFASAAFDGRESDARVLAAEEVLIRGGFAWETVFGEDMGRLDGFAALVLAGQSHMSDAECETVRAFTKAGGALILVGDNGDRDENGRARGRPAFQGFQGGNIARIGADVICAKEAGGRAARIMLPESWTQMADEIDRVAGERLSVRLRGAGTIALSASEIEGGRLVIHLVNYAAGATPEGLRLDLGKRWKGAGAARMLVPDGPGRDLVVRDVSGPMLELPPFAVYGVVIVG